MNDTGIGLSEEEVSRLFKPFAHMESDFSDKYSGAGLGLAITQKLIEIMRGTVEVKSEVGKGTTVELVIPFSPVPEELRRDRKSGRKKGADAGEALRANTIIVDDEESSRLVNASLMRFLGYTCDMASDGNDLLEKLRHQSYKIILMDIMMPGLDGFEATRRIRNGECGERNREAFIIAVTGCVGDDDRERGLRAGINTYLNKPVTIKALKESIRDYYSLGYSV